jgi:hypothetical protein
MLDLAQSLFEQYLVWNFLQGTIMFMKLFSHICKDDQQVYFFPFTIYIPKQLHLNMPYTGPTYSVIFGGCFRWHNPLPSLMFFRRIKRVADSAVSLQATLSVNPC